MRTKILVFASMTVACMGAPLQAAWTVACGTCIPSAAWQTTGLADAVWMPGMLARAEANPNERFSPDGRPASR